MAGWKNCALGCVSCRPQRRCLMPTSPYKVTPIFDEEILPAAIRREHRTKPGVWGLLRVLEGEVKLVFTNSPQPIVVTPGRPAPIPPEATHHVATHGPKRLQIEFYHERPDAAAESSGNG